MQKMFKNKSYDLKNTIDQSKRILSIPTHQGLSKKQLKYIVDTVNGYYAKKKQHSQNFLQKFIKSEDQKTKKHN